MPAGLGDDWTAVSSDPQTTMKAGPGPGLCSLRLDNLGSDSTSPRPESRHKTTPLPGSCAVQLQSAAQEGASQRHSAERCRAVVAVLLSISADPAEGRQRAHVASVD